MKKSKTYAVIDVETTGGRANRARVIEVAIVLHNGQSVLEEWSSLIDPETYIPRGITELTGITQKMVQGAPKFYEVAKHIVEMTEGCIFVAHNARFDYSFIREEFQRLGYTYTRKQLCTVRLSRKAFPGLPSYSLGRLAPHLGITNDARHRALGDAKATAEMLSMILQQEENEQSADEMINLGIREALLPQNVSLETIHALPEECGVYYFYNKKGDVVYVGKSINIKKRVAEHFAVKTEKARKLQQHVHEISYELTGNELVALLYESEEIKRIRPMINRAQRVRHFPFVVHHWVSADGYLSMGVEQVNASRRKQIQVASEYPKLSNAKGHLHRMMEKYELCAHLCKTHPDRGACFHYHIKQCHGACVKQESAEEYNKRAQLALEEITTIFEEDFFLIDKGRTPEEVAVVLVEAGDYQGFGYIDKQELNGNTDILRDAIQSRQGNPETRRIIQRYLSKNTDVQQIPIKQDARF